MMELRTTLPSLGVRGAGYRARPKAIPVGMHTTAANITHQTSTGLSLVIIFQVNVIIVILHPMQVDINSVVKCQYNL